MKTNTKPGPKPGPPRRDYHFRLLIEPQGNEAVSLADAFDCLSEKYDGDQAFIVKLLLDHPEIQKLLQGNP
jgi:hypothetical protein